MSARMAEEDTGRMSRRFAASALHEFVASALERTGARPEDAGLVTEGLVAADLRGVHTHGVLRAGIYVTRLRAGSINADASLSVVADTGPVAVVDAGAGFGIAMAARAMDLAADRAAAHGAGFVGVRNSNHCGMLAWLAMRAVALGMVGVAISNADSQVAPWGARTKYLGTNPLAIGVPAGEEPPLVLDMATSVVPHSRIQAAEARGEQIESGWALDSKGRATTDPAAALCGALLPFGGPKGSGVSFMIDVLAGLLTGALSGPAIAPLYEQLDRPQGVGHLMLALSVEAFGPKAKFAARVDNLIREVRSLPPAEGYDRVYLPGEREHLSMLDYSRNGIPLPDHVVEATERLAAEAGMDAPQPL